MLGTILVPLDGSPLAEQALPHACRLARVTGAGLVLLRAAPYATNTGATASPQRVTMRDAEAYLQPVCQGLRDAGFAVHSVALHGDPARTILFAARVHGAEIIVMSTHGRSGLRTLVLGSVAERVLGQSAIPVLLVRAADQPSVVDAGTSTTILVPLDGSPCAEAALAYVVREDLCPSAELVLLRAVPNRSPAFSLGAVRYADHVRFDQEQGRMEAREYLDRVAPASMPTHQAHVVMDYPAKAIVELAHEREVDLIVMATHGRNGLDRLAHGSVAGHVLHHASMPVLILHGRDCIPSVRESAVIETVPIAHPAPEWPAPVALVARKVDGDD